MKYQSILFSLLIFSLFLSCENRNNSKKVFSKETKIDLSSKGEDSSILKTNNHKSDTLISTKNSESFLNKKNLKTADYIVHCSKDQKAEITRYIDNLRKEWQNTPNPLIATYEGNDFGDYQHIIFKASNNVFYDFGQAENNFVPYKLFELSEQYEDNPAFVGKEFKIYWDWKIAEFLCCDGEYKEVKAYIPSITKLELIKK